MITRLIIFLIRIKLGVKKNQKFQFANQKSAMDVYYFTDTHLMKNEFKGQTKKTRPSNVSLTWLLSDKCEIKVCRNPNDILRDINRIYRRTK